MGDLHDSTWVILGLSAMTEKCSSMGIRTHVSQHMVTVEPTRYDSASAETWNSAKKTLCHTGVYVVRLTRQIHWHVVRYPDAHRVISIRDNPGERGGQGDASVVRDITKSINPAKGTWAWHVWRLEVPQDRRMGEATPLSPGSVSSIN